MPVNLFRNPQYAIRILYCVLFFSLAGCVPAPAPTPFIAPFTRQATPTRETLPTSNSPVVQTPPVIVTETSTPQASTTPLQSLPAGTSEPTSSTPINCTNSLTFVADLSYPDGSLVNAGQTLEKQWRVTNSGTCDWTQGYHIKLVSGYSAFGAASEQVLPPALAGSQATIAITFTAPLDAGNYQTAWQAYTPDGTPFGDTIFMIINVGQ